MAQPTYVSLNDGYSIPQLGLGTMLQGDRIFDSIKAALSLGYRHFDTAKLYGNETDVGNAIRMSSVPRSQIFITTKLWNNDQGFDSALEAGKASFERLGVGYIDLYLIHWPCPQYERYVETWRALIRLKDEGVVRSIGVSNFTPEHLARLIEETGVVPAINQIELHPRFQQRQLREIHRQLGIVTESWAPLGQATVLRDPTIAAVAEKHLRTPAQTLLRWQLDNDIVAIPKSSHSGRIAENFAVFDFHLDPDDHTRIAALDTSDGRIGPDPLAYAPA